MYYAIGDGPVTSTQFVFRITEVLLVVHGESCERKIKIHDFYWHFFRNFESNSNSVQHLNCCETHDDDVT